jgi:hypothetical protein
MARTHEVLKSASPKSRQSNKCYGGIGEEEQGGNPQGTSRSRSNRFPSHRGDIDWWKYRSRTPLSFPSKRFKKHGRDGDEGKALQGQQWRTEIIEKPPSK